MDIQQVFSENVKKYRKRAHLTQEGLAEKSGLHRTYIGGIEQQRINVSLKNIEKIAGALEIDPALLFIHEKPTERNDKVSHVKKNIQQDGKLSKGDYGLLAWTDNGITIEPLDSHDEELTISILCALIAEGHEEDLAQAYEKAQIEILNFFRNRKADVS